MRLVSTVLLIVSGIFGLLGARSYWRDQGYKNASVAVRGTVRSVEIQKIRDGLSNIIYSLAYLRDGITDSTQHKITTAYTNADPLPTLKELQAASFYVRYVPKPRQRETAYPERVMVHSNSTYPGYFNRSLFGQMFTFAIIGFMVRLFGRKGKSGV